MCTSAGTRAIFESVQIVGATIVVTGGASAIVSRCTILDCPVAVLVRGARSNALVRRSSVRGCAAFVVATGGGAAKVNDSTVQMSDCGAAAVDVRGPGSHFQASNSTMSAPGPSSADSGAVDAAGLVAGRGIRGRSGATIELVKYHVSGFMTGMDVCGAGTVLEARECNVHENIRAGIVVGHGAAAELVGCSAGRGGNQALVVRDLGTSVRADRCGFGGTTGDAVVATDGAGIRIQECNLAHVLQGRALAVSGTSSRVKCMECEIDDNKGGGLAVSACGSCVLSNCKITMSFGNAVEVAGVGSHADLDSCQLDNSASDGFSSTDGGVLTAMKCTIRRSGGSALSATGEQACIRATECLISETVLHCLCINSGGVGVLQACEVGPSTTGAGVHVQGAGSRAELQSTNVDSAGGTVVAMGGATAEVRKCHLESGVRAGGAGTRMRLTESAVQGVSVVKGSAVLQAVTCSFSVKPQVVPVETRSGWYAEQSKSEGTIELSDDSTWQVEPLQCDELRMYIYDPEWNGVTERVAARDVMPEAIDARAAPGELAGLRERFWDRGPPAPRLGDIEPQNPEVHDSLFNSQDSSDGPADTDAYIRAPVVPQAGRSSGASHSAQHGAGSSSADGSAATGTVTPMHASSEAGTHASRSRPFWQQSSSSSNRFAAMMGAALAGTRTRPSQSPASTINGSNTAPGLIPHAGVASAPHSSTRQRSAAAAASTGPSGSSSREATAEHAAPPVSSDASAASLQLQAAAAGPTQAHDPATVHAGMQPPGAVAVPGPHLLPQAPAARAPQQREQRMPQLLTNFDSGAQPSTEGSTSAVSTLNAPVHGAFLPPEDLRDMHAGNILGREPSRGATQMAAHAAQAETTLSPHAPTRLAARERDRSSREHREHAAAGHYGDPGAPHGTAQHARRGAPPRRSHTSPRQVPEAAPGLLPLHASSVAPPLPRFAACASNGGGAQPPSSAAGRNTHGVQEDFLNRLAHDAATSAGSAQEHGRMQSSALAHSMHSAHTHEQAVVGSSEAGAAAVTATGAARATRSDRSAGDTEGGRRRSGIMGAAAAMRSRLRRGRSGHDA